MARAEIDQLTEAIRVGASRERVNRTLASVVRLGSLDQHDRRYVIGSVSGRYDDAYRRPGACRTVRDVIARLIDYRLSG